MLFEEEHFKDFKFNGDDNALKMQEEISRAVYQSSPPIVKANKDLLIRIEDF